MTNLYTAYAEELKSKGKDINDPNVRLKEAKCKPEKQ